MMRGYFPSPDTSPPDRSAATLYINATMSEDLDTRRKRLLFQSIYRGTKEADYLVGGFARAHLGAMTEAQLDQFEPMLSLEDVDLVAWMTGRVPPPAEIDHDVMGLMKSFAQNPNSLDLSSLS
jgi:antitoxin CptB